MCEEVLPKDEADSGPAELRKGMQLHHTVDMVATADTCTAIFCETTLIALSHPDSFMWCSSAKSRLRCGNWRRGA